MEYTSLDDFLIDNKEHNIEILDRVSKKIYIYNINDFKLKKIINIPFDFCFKFAKKEDVYFFQTNYARNFVGNIKTNSDVITLNSKTNKMNIMFDKILPDNENQFWEFTRVFYQNKAGDLYLSLAWHDYIYRIENIRAIQHINIDKKNKGIPKSVIDGTFSTKMDFLNSDEAQSKIHFFRLQMLDDNNLIMKYGLGYPPKFLYYMELNNGNKIINTNNIVNDMTPSSYNNFDIFSTENNKLISVVYPYREENSELLSHLNVKNDDNPIILIANIKQYEK